MTEFRRDPLTHRWVITGLQEGEKPEQLLPNRKKNPDAQCHFCEGNEFLTPSESYSVRDRGQANQPGWQIRVVPNRGTDMRLTDLSKRPQGGVYDMQNASGIHETIIESPQHVTQLSQLEIPAIVRLFQTFKLRSEEHRRNHILKSTLILKNQGTGGPSKFEHAHSQIISVPFRLKTIADELEGAQRYHRFKSRCIFCDMAVEEKKLNLRILEERGEYLAWCPFASRFPFEIWILSRKHHADFTQANAQSFEDLAHVFRNALRSVEKVLGNSPISIVLHTAPLRYDSPEEQLVASEAYHWHIEILPHALPAGGFEWGGDFFLSPPTPENCAAVLRGNP